jgi:hypothetical protein
VCGSGQGISPHVETHSAFKDVLLSLTLESGAVMTLLLMAANDAHGMTWCRIQKPCINSAEDSMAYGLHRSDPSLAFLCVSVCVRGAVTELRRPTWIHSLDSNICMTQA